MKNLLWMLLVLVVFASCQRASMEEAMNQEAAFSTAEKEIMPVRSKLATPNVPADRKLIWTGDLEMQVKNVDKTTDDVHKICAKYGAFVSDMNMSSDAYQISNDITIRVKSVNFTKLINDIKGKADYIKKIDISSNDVTEEYIDIESRLKTKREVRDRYIEILKNNTGKISEVLEAEEAIRKITEEIEAKEGRLRYLNDKVKYSTINIFLYQKVEFQPEPKVFEKSYLDKAFEALENGWSFITYLLLLLINIWPLLLVIAIIYWKRKWIKRKMKKEKKSDS